MIHLELDVDESAIALFLPLLQKGVVLTARTGCSVRQLVCDQLGIAEDYLDHRVQTLFLDARPVDDVDRAIVRDGACLALSAAMPGLLGATMRKGGRYAAFRKAISADTETAAVGTGSGTVTLKLFNMVAREAGEAVLAHGVIVAGSDLKRTAARQPAALQHILAIRVDGQAADETDAVFRTLDDSLLHLNVCVAGAPR